MTIFYQSFIYTLEKLKLFILLFCIKIKYAKIMFGDMYENGYY